MSHLVLVLAGGGQMHVGVTEVLHGEPVELVEGGLCCRLTHVRHLGHVLEEVAPPSMCSDARTCKPK